MSTATRDRAHCGGAFVAAALMMTALMRLVACERSPSATGGGAPAAPSAEKSAAPRAAARAEMAVLGPDERRVPLLVVPGDASVEVDGQPAYPRNGAIDLTGEVGEVRLVRVWKGAKTPLEKAVTIQEPQPFPPVVDMTEASPAKPRAKPRGPARFPDFDDD